MTCAEALALLDEAEGLLPPSGRGLPTLDACRRLEEIGNILLRDAPAPLDRIVMRASAVRNVAHRWSTPGRSHPGAAERAKWLVRRDLDDLRRTINRIGTEAFGESTTGSPSLGERLGRWLQS